MEMQVSRIDGAMVYMVQAVRAGFDDYQVEGVFTVSDDAFEYRQALLREGRFLDVAKPEYVPMKTVLDLLVRDRLGALSDQIKALLELQKGAVEEDHF
ncbi:hypothetical protein [Marinobacterium lutimaris]|uniref:Uncharacterized protein n=1 Tax=Marinobacterium lutimaris TaxID=568106 RepID=A0A1H5XN58_9GAMM|nr:hypothetical protein [Marinobacterium lutimaris]SEG12810.1 hypothetical protein SAMN05444390_1011434 [Marinobacterium lutimaris]